MVQNCPVPPPLSEQDLEQGRKLIAAASHNPRSPLNAHPDLIACLYYPLRQVPLPAFQYEMLLWQNDKLNIFNEATSLKFGDPSPLPSSIPTPVVKYKRVDPFTVIAVAASGDTAIVYTNEVSQTTWEIIGVFDMPGLLQQLKENRHSFVDHDSIETSFKERKLREQQHEEKKGSVTNSSDRNKKESVTDKHHSTDADDSDDDYWNKYDEESDAQESCAEASNNGDEESYWNRYSEESEKADEGVVRSYVVQVLADLVELYKDCGTKAIDVIVEDILSIGAGHEYSPEDGQISPIAHRHAVRTIEWIKASNPSYAEELLMSVQKIQLNA